MRKLVIALVFALVATSFGCGASLVRQRAAFDFGCPEAQIKVVDAGGGAVGALGCGKKASYVFVHGTGWVRNSEIQTAHR